MLGGLGCAANQAQTQETRQPVESRQPVQQESIQQTPTQGPFAYAGYETNPHGKQPWDPKFFKQDETADSDAGSAYMSFPDALADKETLALAWINAQSQPRTQNTYNWYMSDIHTTQTVSNTHDGTLTQTPSVSPSSTQSPGSTTTGGAMDQRQQPTASTAVDIPVAAAPGSSAAGGAPYAGAGGGESGSNAGGPNTNTPTSTGSNTPPAASTAIPQGPAAALLGRIGADPALRDAINTALANNGQSGDATVNMILGLMQRDPNFAASVLGSLGPTVSAGETSSPADGG